MTNVQEALIEAFEALLPFADCLQYIEIDEEDEEWAKFRLLIKHYRQAAIAYEKCKSALSDIENCEPVGYLVNDGESVDYIPKNEVVLSAIEASKIAMPLYTSPISKECEGWVSVDELPADYNKKVGDGYKKYWVIDSIGNQWSAELYYIAEGASTPITHWQPLPAAPTDKE